MAIARYLGLIAALFSAGGALADDLPGGEGKPLVIGHCSGCHSLSLVTSQRGDRVFWKKTIVWMQRTQNLWEIPAEQESMILDYLETHFSESEWGRRPNLSPSLRPVLLEPKPRIQ